MFTLRSAMFTWLAFITLLVGFAGQTQAESLTFGVGAPSSAIDQNYGDRLISTPNVAVSYGPDASDIRLWNSGYGDLNGVIYREAEGAGILEVALRADQGFMVSLHSFDMAGWYNRDYVINSVQVLNESNDVLFSENNVHIQGDFVGPRRTSFNFATPLLSSTLMIRFDSMNLLGASDNIGLSNIVFGQTTSAPNPEPVPEPATMILLGTGLAGIAAKVRKNRKGNDDKQV